MQFYSEVYIAVKFSEKKAAYLSPWVTQGNIKSTELPHAPKIKLFSSGTCLFGDSLKGKNQFGQAYPLVERDQIHAMTGIVTSVIGDKELSAYELVMYQMFDILLPMIELLGSYKNVEISYHIPVPEYILYGIDYYLNQKITLEALLEYIQKVNERGYQHKAMMHYFGLASNKKVYCFSPLDSLALEELVTKEKLHAFIKSFTIPALLTSLRNQPGVSGETWKHALTHLEDESTLTLFDLNKMSYSVKVAIDSYYKDHLEVALVDYANERPIALNYAKNFIGTWPAILSIHWLPGIMVYAQEKNHSLFFAGEDSNAIRVTIKEGILRKQSESLAKSIK